MWDMISITWEVTKYCCLPWVIPGLIIFFIYVRGKRSTSSSLVRHVSNIGLGLTALGLVAFTLTVTYRPPSQCAGCFPRSSISDTDISGLRISTSWWFDQETHSSNFIEVEILPTPSTTPTVEPSQTQASSQLTPVGTPNVPIAQAFGAHYDVFARASLSASAFDVDPRQQPIQSLDQKGVLFFWTVTPKYAGSQVLNISVTGIWRPKGGGEEIERPLAGHLLDVKVTDPGWSLFGSLPGLGQTVLGELIITFAGLMMNIPWIWVVLKKRGEKKHLAGSPLKTMQMTANERSYSESTTIIPSNKITMQETGKLQPDAEEKPTLHIRIYLSCSSDPRDTMLLDELKKQLNMLQRQSDVSLWEKRLISPGADWEREIFTHINQSHLILCLVSPDFMASDQCYEEMKLATRRMDTGETSVIPLLIRHTTGWQDTPIGKLQPLPDDREPISGREDWEREMSNIAERIRHIVEQIRQSITNKGP